MKQSAIQWVRRLSLLSIAAAMLSLNAHAQVSLTPYIITKGSYGSPTITTGSGDACLDYTLGVGNNHTYTAGGLSSLGSLSYSWTVIGGVSIVGSSTGSSIVVKPTIDTKGRYNKGRLTLFYKGTIDSTIAITSCPACNGVTPPTQYQIVKVPKSGTIAVDLYQKFDYTDQIVGNVCVSAGDSAAYSIRDLVSGNVKDGIGLDTYFWDPSGLSAIAGAPQYIAGDSSSMTFKYALDPVIGTTYQIKVTVGRCNVGGSGKQKTKTLSKKVPAPITSPLPSSTTCLVSGTSTFSITNTTKTGITYSWSKSNDNWLYTSGTNSTTQTGVTFNVGAQSGNVYLTSTPSSGAYCGTRTDTIKVKRSLTGSSVSTTPTATTCFTRGQSYTFQITPAPSTAVVWTVPTGWTVDPANLNAPVVTITAGPSALSGTISAAGKDCIGNTNAFTANIAPAKPVITGTACVTRGSSYTFSTPAIYGATSYNWSFPTGWSYTPANASSVTATVGAGGLSGDVTVTAVGCANNTSANYAVTILPPKPGTVTFTPATCVNKGLADTLTFAVAPVAGVTYQWVLPPGWTAAANTTPYSSYAVYTNGVVGSYYVKVRGQSTCGGSTNYSTYDSVLVVVNGIGTNVTITKSPIDSDGDGIQDGENLTANAIASPVKYQWYNASGPIPGETTRFLDLLNTGTPNASYYVRVFKNSCITQANTTSNYAYRVASGPSATELIAKVNVYPIPASDAITIDLPISYEDASVDFVDMTGVNVLTKTLHGKSVSIPLSKVNAGTYYLMFTVDGTAFSKKIVVVK